MYTVELGTIEPGNTDFQAWLLQNKVEMAVLEEHGPGGGNPLVRYACVSLTTLQSMIMEYWGESTDNTELLHLMCHIVWLPDNEFFASQTSLSVD